jgi:thioredoxin reductase
MNNRNDVIIVGSGLAGLAAADLLCRHGLDVLIIDDNMHTGGQLIRNSPHANPLHRGFEPDRLKHRGRILAGALRRRAVQFLNCSQVLGIYPEHTILVEDRHRHVAEYRAKALILATGARERQLPFKGWTLPGVMSTGAAQILMKSSGILPGAKTLIGGCSPLMLVLAAEILANGGQVHAVLDQSRVAAKMKILNAGPAVLPKIFEGAFYMVRLATARVPVRQGIRIVAARGRRQLETVVTARVDFRGRIIPETEHSYATDTLAVGFGFAPNIELPQQAGCAISYSANRGGWAVAVDDAMATSVSGIYAVGETTGIAGAGKSFIEGRLAAWNLLLKKGRVGQQTYADHTRPLMSRHQQQLRYGRLLNLVCQPSPDAYADIPDDTTICRCEEISMGDVRRQVNNGFNSMKGIKMATRCGMGSCQGRTCGPVLFDIISALTRQTPVAVGCTSARAPIKTVALGALAGMATKNSDRPSDRPGE